MHYSKKQDMLKPEGNESKVKSIFCSYHGLLLVIKLLGHLWGISAFLIFDFTIKFFNQSGSQQVEEVQKKHTKK